uniref:Putative 40S ribosomal protein S11 n=1 Tax=Daphnia magna TaxID=35525 RepID=A0A0P6G8J7_9CRUS
MEIIYNILKNIFPVCWHFPIFFLLGENETPCTRGSKLDVPLHFQYTYSTCYSQPTFVLKSSLNTFLTREAVLSNKVPEILVLHIGKNVSTFPTLKHVNTTEYGADDVRNEDTCQTSKHFKIKYFVWKEKSGLKKKTKHKTKSNFFLYFVTRVIIDFLIFIYLHNSASVSTAADRGNFSLARLMARYHAALIITTMNECVI